MLKQFTKWLLIVATLLGGLLTNAQAVERRVALVIGNAKYASAPLTNPPNDARDMAAALRRGGFDVIELIDGTQKEMNRAIAKFGDKLSSDTVALFYYAGHGIQVKGKNYLIPIDAQISNESSIRVESVDVDGVLDQLASSELNVVILDACRNNPFERRVRSVGGGLAQMDAPKGSLIAYATAPGKTAADGDGRNGLFTQELLKQIQVPGLTIEQVFKNVRREVAKATRDNQIPWESSSMTGDFYFVPINRPAAVSNVQPQRPPERQPAAVAAVAKASEADLKNSPSAPASIPAPVKPPAAVVSADPVAAKPAKESTPPVQTALATQKSALSEKLQRTLKTDSFTAVGKLALDAATGDMTGEAVIEWANGDRYEGEMIAGKKEGRGIFTWANGQRYDGEWANDMINGRGVLLYTNGDRYEGDFVNGEPHGTGLYTLRNGDVYKGAWAHGNKHGFGRLTWTNGDYWEGEFRDDLQTNNGKLVYGEAPPDAGATADRGGEKASVTGKPAAKPSAKPAESTKKGK